MFIILYLEYLKICGFFGCQITIAEKTFEMYVPDYMDYLILKLMSARPSDIRDIATLVWKNGIPDHLKEEVKKTLAHPEIIEENLKLII